jgi:hypothetical protein
MIRSTEKVYVFANHPSIYIAVKDDPNDRMSRVDYRSILQDENILDNLYGMP